MRKVQCLLSALLLVLLLVACAPAAAPAPQIPAPAAVPAPAAGVPVAPAKAAWEMEWEKTLAAAKTEGQVVFGTGAGAEARRGLSTVFQDRYGIKVESASATGAPLIARIVTERRAGLYLWDIVITAPTQYQLLAKPAGITSPLESALILPDVTDPEVIKKVWLDGKLPWFDRERHTIIALLAPATSLIYNTNLVKPGEIKSWDDLLNPIWKGKILFQDPTNPAGGSGGSIMPTLYEVKGEDWLRKLAAQEPVLNGDQRLGVEWIARGKYPILIGADTGTYVEFLKSGAPIVTVMTEDVITLSGGVSAILLIDRTPHPNAAKVFINWYLSKEGQTVMSKARLSQSARVDVPTDFLPPDQVRQSGGKYWVKDREEVLIKIDDFYAKSKQIFGHLLK